MQGSNFTLDRKPEASDSSFWPVNSWPDKPDGLMFFTSITIHHYVIVTTWTETNYVQMLTSSLFNSIFQFYSVMKNSEYTLKDKWDKMSLPCHGACSKHLNACFLILLLGLINYMDLRIFSTNLRHEVAARYTIL